MRMYFPVGFLILILPAGTTTYGTSVERAGTWSWKRVERTNDFTHTAHKGTRPSGHQTRLKVNSSNIEPFLVSTDVEKVKVFMVLCWSYIDLKRYCCD